MATLSVCSYSLISEKLAVFEPYLVIRSVVSRLKFHQEIRFGDASGVLMESWFVCRYLALAVVLWGQGILIRVFWRL